MQDVFWPGHTEPLISLLIYEIETHIIEQKIPLSISIYGI